jgi:hypothetical protein
LASVTATTAVGAAHETCRIETAKTPGSAAATTTAPASSPRAAACEQVDEPSLAKVDALLDRLVTFTA